MTTRAAQPTCRREFHDAEGVLLVVRDPPPAVPPAAGQPATVSANPDEGVEILLAVWDDDSVTGLHGRVDLGTGIRTALGQIAADELDIAFDRLHMLLGSTGSVPNQGATIASASIQVHAAPLRQAAAQARAWLLEQAAGRLRVAVADLCVVDGVVASVQHPERRISYGAIVAGRHVELQLSNDASIKKSGDYRIVGQSVPRVDIPAKVAGNLVFVHDMRVPGMLHGRVVRPPYAGVDAGDFVGKTLESVDESSISHIPGIVAVVVIRDFVGVVAEREEHAEQAMRQLQVRWKPWPAVRGLDDLESALSAHPSTRRVLTEQGDVDAAIAGASVAMARSYVWPYQLHASIGPSCALADWRVDAMTVWAGTQNPHVLRADLALLMQLPDTRIDVVRMEASGCYGRNCADDVVADAALLSRAVGKPVRVQLSREQENAWEPKGAAQLMQVNGGLNADGSVAAYDFQTSYPSNGAPTLALLLTGTVPATGTAYEMGDRTAVPPYAFENLRVVANDMAPIVRASWLRGVSALPNSFAHESYIDELATQAGADPVAFRLARLPDERACELLKATAERAGWIPHTVPGQQAPDGDLLKGQGVAYARYVHSRFPGYGAAWAAWVADVEVNRKTGEVHVRRVVVGHDAGMMVNPAGVQHQIHGNVLQATSRALKEEVRFDAQGAPTSLEWGAYPILSFREVPIVEVLMMPRQGEPPLGAGESASVPGTAAIANAIFDATGVRFRQPPFTPEVVRAGMAGLAAIPASETASAANEPVVSRRVAAAAVWPRGKAWWAIAGALIGGVAGLAASLLGARAEIAPMTSHEPSIYSRETIARGRQLAAAGDCAVCHTAPGGAVNAGGHALETPFGVIYSTNLTPDIETGIGAWSLSAFQRAMREGISRDGHLLYPAFPYSAFTKTTDDDLAALYAYLMSQPALRSEVPATRLAFPFNVRPLVSIWNALHLQPGPVADDPAQTAQWNRGAYLVNGLGHCGACHTPRNALQGERSGRSFLSGAMVDGWEAPALTVLGKGPVPWTQAELFRYLRSGYSPQHGVASGPMALVVQELANLPEADVQAMAAYLASFNAQPQADGSATVALADAAVARSRASAAGIRDASQRLFDSACGACHHDGDGPQLLGLNLALALNSNLHSDRPDNVVRLILDGIRTSPSPQVAFMPAFRDSLDDRQIAGLVSHMRRRFAPDKPGWDDVEATVARLRRSGLARVH